MNRHLGIKTHKCYYNECNKSFVKLYELKSHINNIHIKEKLYKCIILKKKLILFKTSDLTSEHLVGVRCFKCIKCFIWKFCIETKNTYFYNKHIYF